jgi:hypothetical protein
VSIQLPGRTFTNSLHLHDKLRRSAKENLLQILSRTQILKMISGLRIDISAPFYQYKGIEENERSFRRGCERRFISPC